MEKRIEQWLTDRGMNLSLYTIWYTDDNKAIFPCFDITGKITGAVKYDPLASKK